MIRMNAFDAEPEALRTAMLAGAERVLRSGWWILGDDVRRFEETWARRCGAAHAVGVANGLDAIEIILRARGIGSGDEVVTTAMTAFATPLAIMRAGARPVFADIDPSTGLLSRESVERVLGERTRAVLLVHLYGQMRDMADWAEFAARTGVDLIEDCAQAHLAQEDGVPAGRSGVAGAFSFYPTKNLGAVGDGGAIVTDDDALAAAMRQLRNYGQSERYHHPVAGLNSRLDELQAAILSARLDYLDGFTERRKEIGARYDAEIVSPHIEKLAPPRMRAAHVRHLYVARSAARSQLEAHLAAAGVQSLRHYPVPAHRQPPCAEARVAPGGLPATETFAEQCLSVPCHPQMSEAEVDQVIAALNAFDPRIVTS